jgi:hypothetical protein
MNPAFEEVLAAGSDAVLSAFDTTALRLGTAAQNIEKDFWVCWTLDALFNGLKEGGPRLLFKGGTSLSKGFGLINRFSEDIDVTVFRNDIGEPATIEELDALSGKKRQARLDAIKYACQAYINGPLLAELTQILQDRLRAAGLVAGAARVEADDTDPDGQTLLIWYPAATPRSDYMRAAIKIESGAKSALDPNSEVPIKPYVDDDLPALDLTVPAVRTVDPERTFWDKVVILHEARRAAWGWATCVPSLLRPAPARRDAGRRRRHRRYSARRGLRRPRSNVLQSTGLRPRKRRARLLRARGA